MSPTNEFLKAVEAQISEAMDHIQEPKSRTVKMETKLQDLREEDAAILKKPADHIRALSDFQNLPEDVIREIFNACVEADMPTLSFGFTPFPCVLAQISSGMRHIALTTPFIWATMNVRTNLFYLDNKQARKEAYEILASKASEWLDRAGGMALTVFMQVPNCYAYTLEDVQSDPSNILFDTLFRYSTCWKRIQIESSYGDVPSAPILRMAALTTVDVPLLESITLCFQSGLSVFRSSPILGIPTLRRLKLDTHWTDRRGRTVISQFKAVNWATLTSITIHGGRGNHVTSVDEIAKILRQTRLLVFCDVAFGAASDHLLGHINLPFLEILCVDDKRFEPTPFGAPGILDLINAPILTSLKIQAKFLDISLANFLERSSGVRELSLSHFNSEESLADITNLLRHCPSLSVITLQPPQWSNSHHPYDANRFLRAFVEDDGVGVTCPRLRNFVFTGAINFSLQTLCRFLEAKQRGTAPLNGLVPWNTVKIDMWATGDLEMLQKLQFVSQKQAEGLDAYVYVKVASR